MGNDPAKQAFFSRVAHLTPWSNRPPTAPATAPTPPVAAPRTASQPMNTAAETTNEPMAAAWFFTNVPVALAMCTVS